MSKRWLQRMIKRTRFWCVRKSGAQSEPYQLTFQMSSKTETTYGCMRANSHPLPKSLIYTKSFKNCVHETIVLCCRLNITPLSLSQIMTLNNTKLRPYDGYNTKPCLVASTCNNEKICCMGRQVTSSVSCKLLASFMSYIVSPTHNPIAQPIMNFFRLKLICKFSWNQNDDWCLHDPRSSDMFAS